MRRRHPPAGRLVDVEGRAVHLRSAGDTGPSVVSVSGAGSTSASWSLVQPEVAQWARTYAYDRPGFAWSDEVRSPRTVATMAGELRTLLRGVSAPPPYVLVAHSLGGAIAEQFASDDPDSVAGYVFVDAAYADLYERFITLHPGWLKRIRRSRSMLRLAQVAASLRLMRVLPVNLASKKLPPQEYAAANAMARTPTFFRSMRAEIDGLIASRDAPRPSAPTDRRTIVLTHDTAHALFGRAELEDLWAELQRELAGRFSEAELRVVEGAGHFIQLDAPEAVIDAVRSVSRSADQAGDPAQR